LKNHFLYFTCLALLFAGCSSDGDTQQAIAGGKKPSQEKIVKDTVAKLSVAKRHISYLDSVFKDYGLVDIATLDTSIKTDLRYAGTNNFLKRDFYDGLVNAYFNCETAMRLCRAQQYLKQVNNKLSLIVLDASRPQHIQQLMWDSLDMPPDVKFNYLSPPYKKSLHNYGCAADVSIIDLTNGRLLDMGSDYDFFGKISEPVYEERFLKSGELSKAAYENRLLLRKVMKLAKFNGIRSEWWHFSACSKAEAMAKFKLIK